MKLRITIFCLFMFSCNETEIGRLMLVKLQNESGFSIKETIVSFEVPGGFNVDTPIVINKIADKSSKEVWYNFENIYGFQNVTISLSITYDDSQKKSLKKGIFTIDSRNAYSGCLVTIKSDTLIVSIIGR